MPEAKLTITMTPTGDVTVTGPIGNKMLCYSMLEMARDAIQDSAKAAERLVQPVGLSLVPPVGGR